MKDEDPESGTVKTSSIIIANGHKTSVYRTIDEVPLRLRRKLAQSTSGSNSGTLLIADRRGAQHLLRASVRALLYERLERPPGFLAVAVDDARQLLRLLRRYWLASALLVLSLGSLAWWLQR
jgi:hypothetical protein